MKTFPRSSTALAAAMLAALAMGSAARAQQAAPPRSAPMPGMAMPMTPGGNAEAPMMASMDKMSKDMAAVPMTGDVDQNFGAMMIPHHQGAIDMARYELANGKDPAMRRMARNVITAQEKEIATLKAWQAKRSAAR